MRLTAAHSGDGQLCPAAAGRDCCRLGEALGLPAILGLSIGLLAAPVGRTADSPDRIDDVAFFSAALGREMRFVVVRPADRDRDRPVLYLLHGRGRHRHSLLELPDAQAALLDANLWVVLPDGEDGWYLNSPVNPADRYADHLDLILQEAVSRYGLRDDPGGQAIAGWSMGGYGAVRFAQMHPGRFSAVATIIGLLDFPRDETLPPGRNYKVPVTRFGDDPAAWRALNPLHQAVTLRGSAVLVLTADDAFDRVMNESFSRELDRVGVPHAYRMLPGGHTLDVVRAALLEVLAFVQRSSLPPPRP